MMLRFFSLLFLLAVAVLPSGCSSTDNASDDEMETFHSTPASADDSHGWGANIQGLGGGRSN